MKKLLLSVFVLAGLLASTASAQFNTLVQTSITGAINATQQIIPVAAVTGITATLASPTLIVIDREVLTVTSVGTLSLGVQRGTNGTAATSHINASMVLAGRPGWFQPPPGSKDGNPTGTSCVTASTIATPYVNLATGRQYLCSTVTLTWGPGFGNTADGPPQVGLLVASAAGQITPSGPLFHSNGTAAVTGFLYPIGMAVGQPAGAFCQIPDAVFTWTATNNIAVAGTAVVNRTVCWTWDYTNAKWVPSYV